VVEAPEHRRTAAYGEAAELTLNVAPIRFASAIPPNELAVEWRLRLSGNSQARRVGACCGRLLMPKGLISPESWCRQKSGHGRARRLPFFEIYSLIFKPIRPDREWSERCAVSNGRQPALARHLGASDFSWPIHLLTEK